MNFFPKNMFCHVFHSVSFCFHVIMNASLIMPFLLLFPSICVTPNHPERFKEKTAERKKRRVAKFGWNHSVEGFWTEGLNTFLCAITLYVCVCLRFKCALLKGNHVSDIHLGLFPPLDQLHHTGQNPR